jgi:hypothetical protein
MTTLVRLSFWIRPEHWQAFATEYETGVLPILKKHGLTPSVEKGRPTVKDVFNQLFEIETPAAFVACKKAIYRDPDGAGSA